MRRYWFSYLSNQGLAEIAPSQLNEQVMAGFLAWLRQLRKEDGNPLHPNTIGRALGNVRNALHAVPNAQQWADLIPAGPRGAARKTEPTAVLQFDQLLKVMTAVDQEILGLQSLWAGAPQLLELGRQQLREGKVLPPIRSSTKEDNPRALLALTLALLDQRYSGVIPDQSVIMSDDRLLGTTIKQHFGASVVTSFFYATYLELVPFVLHIAIATAFNPETVLTLRWANIERGVDRLTNKHSAVKFDVTDNDTEASDVVATELPLVKMTGDKPRSQRQLVRLLDPEASRPEQVSLNLVLDLLSTITSRIRPYVIEPLHADRLFLSVPTNCAKHPKGFGISSSTSACSDITWRYSLRKFITDNKLPAFTLKTIRATLLDYAQLFNRGDLEAARKVGNHRHRLTTWTHYTSDLVKRLLQESSGETLLVRERWLQSNGTIDPRKYRAWTDKGCATPGFACMDPFDSPRPNQRPGKLCKAYGECPDCPMALARPESPRHITLYEALRRAIYRSVTRVTAAVWQERWAPVIAALDALLACVPPSVLDESRKLSLELPDVG